MEWAQNSDYKTHLKKQNPTYRKEIKLKSLKYLFLETPCTKGGTSDSTRCGTTID